MFCFKNTDVSNTPMFNDHGPVHCIWTTQRETSSKVYFSNFRQIHKEKDPARVGGIIVYAMFPVVYANFVSKLYFLFCQTI